MADKFINDTVYFSFSESRDSNSSGYSCEFQPEHSYVGQVVYKVLLIATLILGLAGNGAVLSLIAFIRELRCTTNTYLAILCGANVVILLSYLPIALPDATLKFFETLSVPYANWLSYELRLHCSVSILALIILSFGRWRAVVKPMNVQKETSTVFVAKLIVFFIVAAIITLPYAFVHEAPEKEEPSGPKNTLKYEYTIIVIYYGAVLLYLVPLAIIFSLYVSMAKKLLSNGGKIRETLRRYQRTRARRGRVALVVLGLVLSFAICWLPSNLFHVLGVTGLHCTFPKFAEFLQLWMTPILLLNTCTDPFSIFLLGSRFRVHLINALHLRRLCGYTAEQHKYQGTVNGNTQCTMTSERKSSKNDAVRLKPLIHNEDGVQGKRTH